MWDLRIGRLIGWWGRGFGWWYTELFSEYTVWVCTRKVVWRRQCECSWCHWAVQLKQLCVYVLSFLLCYYFVIGCAGSLLPRVVFSSCGVGASFCVGLLWSTGSRCTGFHCCGSWAQLPIACGIYLDQDSNPCPLHWQADSSWTTREALWLVILCYRHFTTVK